MPEPLRPRSGVVRAVAALLLPIALQAAGCRTASESAPMTAPNHDTPAVAAETATSDLARAVETWHADRVERLTTDDGYLTLVGLDWLEPGRNTAGRGAAAAVRAEGLASDEVGAFVLDAEGTVRFEAAAPGLVEGVPASGVLAHDGQGEPTILRSGRVMMHVIERDGRLAVRVRDPEAPARVGFAGIERFPVDPDWRIVASFTPERDPDASMPIELIIGGSEPMDVAGRANFTHGGHACSVVLLEGGANRYFLVFGDRTNGEATYGAGRFLAVERGEDPRSVVLDFNRAYNPPCSFTPYATCPLPPADNRLPFAVTAGERAPRPPRSTAAAGAG